MIVNQQHFDWSFGGISRASPVDAQSVNFNFSFNFLHGSPLFDFRQECLNACIRLDKLRAGKTIALCYSAGLRSEIIALCLSLLGIPYELYFLDIWGINSRQFFQLLGLSRIVEKKQVHIVSIDRMHFYDFISKKQFKAFAIEAPTYIALTALFDKIPKNQFIVTGDGCLQRRARAYSSIAKKFPIAEEQRSSTLPFKTSSIFYYLWSKENAREGEYYFFRSTPEIVLSQIFDKAFYCNYPSCETNNIFEAHFPEVYQREKSTNWNADARKENAWIRDWLALYAKQLRYSFWHESAGVPVPIHTKPLIPV